MSRFDSNSRIRSPGFLASDGKCLHPEPLLHAVLELADKK